MGDAALAAAFAQDIVYLKQSGVNPIVVHGGGPQIAEMLKKHDIKSEFVNGLRVTDQPTVEIVEMVLAGAINKEIVTAINRQGGKAVGICGKDANLMIARKITEMPDPKTGIVGKVDLGFVGDPLQVNPHIVEVISKSDLIPVIAPVALSREGETLNVNADSFASALAARLKAKRLLLLTDVEGVLDKSGKLIEELSVDQAQDLIRDGTISGGMIPKIEGCIEVVEAGVEAVVIINGKVPHCVLLELLTDHGAERSSAAASRRLKRRRNERVRRFRQGSGSKTGTRRTVPPSSLGRLRVWIFDLDNTLYPAECNLFAQVDQRMGEFIANHLGVPFEYARHLQKSYYRQFGTTLAGLMRVHKMQPEPFLDYVHDIDISVVPEAPALRAAIDRLPGRKLIFTNGSRAHAERVAGKLGILDLFEGITDIASCGYEPKPSAGAFNSMISHHGVAATEAAMFEDMPQNLEVPHKLGMSTVLVHSTYMDHPIQRDMRKWSALPEHIHHFTDDLTAFLEMIAVNDGQ